ncbi:MAG: GTPase Era [Candidatus Omnitrophota bacterium]|nr:GTPase Era [Candidatus Omnitrophota bacterium]
MAKKENNFRCGVVSIVGRPNVGKSTLLNEILGHKVAIVSPVPQTTRQQIRGIYHEERGQIIFIDTPGVHEGKDHLNKYMNSASMGTLDEVDCVIYLVDTSRKIGEEEHNVAGHLKSLKIPIIVGLNKIDLKGKYLAEYIEFWEKVVGKPVQEMTNCTLVALSGEEGKNIDKLVDVVFEYLPIGPALYPADIKSDVPQRAVIADIIREKLFNCLRDELPHAVAVSVEQMQRRKKAIYIQATIYVERDTQKIIVIGGNGQLLKDIGTLARTELESLLGAKIFLELFVKTQKNWRDNLSTLQELGYFNS